jgi:hypothetical protein
MNWESIETSDGYLERLKVFGGWLVRSSNAVYHDRGGNYPVNLCHESRVALVFVPDPNHEWQIN